MASQPQVIDRKIIRTIVGDRTVESMPMVAKEFGVSATTIRQSWRANGMPGKNGNYNLADILLWRLELEKKNEKYTKPKEHSGTTLNELAIEDAKVSLAIKKAKYQENEGQLISREEVRAELYAMLAVFSKTLLEVPRALSPLLPKKLSVKVVAECEKLLRHALRARPEKCHKTYMKEGEENDL